MWDQPTTLQSPNESDTYLSYQKTLVFNTKAIQQYIL